MAKTDINILKFRHNNLKEAAAILGLACEPIRGRSGKGVVGYNITGEGREFIVIVGTNGFQIFKKFRENMGRKNIVVHIDFSNPDKVISFEMGKPAAEAAILAGF